MKELITRVWCDHCDQLEEGNRVEAHGHHIILIDGKPRELDLCEAAEKELLGPVLDLLDSHGSPFRGDIERVARTTPRAGAPAAQGSSTARAGYTPEGKPLVVTCPLDGVELQRGSLVSHAEARHGVPRPEQPKQCPTCGYTPSDPTNQQSMVTHRTRGHGYDPRGELLETLSQMAAAGQSVASQ